MPRVQNPNLEILTLAVDQLGELADEMVFLGGCATGLLITDPAAPSIRVTRDVDAIVQAVSLAEYHKLLKRLRALGFKEDISEGAPICRWSSDSVILDIIPTDTAILGFGNKWFIPAAENAEFIELPSGRHIRTVSAPYFLVTKLEAFEGRGGGDYLMSHDMEDIIAVLDGRPELIEEIQQSDPLLTKELGGRFKTLLQDHRFVDAVSGHMPTDETSQARVTIILGTIEKIASSYDAY